MSALTVSTPLRLAECGCTLETGDAGRPLFVQCQTHRAAATMLEALEDLVRHATDDKPHTMSWMQARLAIQAAGGGVRSVGGCAVVMRKNGQDVRCTRPASLGDRCKRHGGGVK